MMGGVTADPSSDPLVQRMAAAVHATAKPLAVAVQPYLADAILVSMREGISQAHADWWARTGQYKVTGWLNDNLCSDSAVNMWAAACVMHAAIVTGQPVDDDHEVDIAEWAALAVAWDSGRRDIPVAFQNTRGFDDGLGA